MNRINTRTKVMLAIIITLLMMNYLFYNVHPGKAPSSNESLNNTPSIGLINNFIEKYSAHNIASRDIFENAKTPHKQIVNHGRHSRPHQSIPNKSSNLMEIPSLASDKEQNSQLDSIKLLGIVIRGAQRKCYLGLNSEKVIANTGDTIFGEYVVDSINVSSVVIHERETSTTRIILVSGK